MIKDGFNHISELENYFDRLDYERVGNMSISSPETYKGLLKKAAANKLLGYSLLLSASNTLSMS